MAWEQGAGEPEGDPTQHALCSKAGSQPCLCWITQRTSPTRPTAGGHFPSGAEGGILSYGKTLFYACFYLVNSDSDNKNGSQVTFWGTDEHIFEEHWRKKNNSRCLAINTKLNLTMCDDAPYK